MFQSCFQKNDRQSDCRKEFYVFGRFPSVAGSFALFWVLIELIFVIKLRVLVFFLSMIDFTMI